MKSEKRKKWMIVLCVIAIFFGSILAYDAHQVRSAYREALDLMERECYSEAADKLCSIKEEYYLDTEALYFYCLAKEAYARGKIKNAYYYTSYCAVYYQTAEQEREIREFVQKVKAEYAEYKEQEQIARQEAYELKVTTGVPFVGMSEENIDRTSLGAPSSTIRHNTEVRGSDVYTSNIYDFYTASGKVFTARCVEGKVTHVWDRRDNPIVESSKPKESNNTKKEDPFNASDYYDAEDFYDDNYDEFLDFEDAEDYWRDAVDK